MHTLHRNVLEAKLKMNEWIETVVKECENINTHTHTHSLTCASNTQRKKIVMDWFLEMCENIVL